MRRGGAALDVTDPLGAVTRFRRDKFGRAISVTDPLGNTTTPMDCRTAAPSTCVVSR
ncbi:RHS repeat protein [Streptomyces decoyicus]